MLPFDHCALSLRPWETAVCTEHGDVYDHLQVLPYIEIHGKDPVTGLELKPRELIRLKMEKKDDIFVCPITEKPLTNHSEVVVNRKTGHVYSREGLEQLRAKDGWCDFHTDEPFTTDDLITIQDPSKPALRDIGQFFHVKQRVKVDAARPETASTPLAVGKESAHLSLPSPPTKTAAETAMFEAVKGTGKATIRTSQGDIHIELFCQKAPRTCYNFISLARRGYYTGVKFHRLIPGFVLQGGDPTGTGGGGTSIWNRPFKDEFAQGLSHNARGVISMANKGPNTNTSQFFITFSQATHLDRVHPIFAKLIGGLDVLERIEQLETTSAARPVKPLLIVDVIIVEDPFKTYQERQSATTVPKQKGRDPMQAVKRAKTTINDVHSIGRYIRKPL